MKRFGKLAAGLSSICLVAGGMAHATSPVDAYPEKPITIVAPYPPGGATDMFARTIGEGLQNVLGQPVVVDNRPGASGVIGASSVARAEPDGYTVVVGAVSLHAILPLLLDRMRETQESLTPVSPLANLPSYVVVPAASPARNIAELIEMIRANPKKYSYGSAGIGTSQHVIPELFKQEAGLDILHVPYKGSGPMVVDLMAGRVDMIIEQGPAALNHIRAGKLRALAVTTKQRTEQLPDVPTLDETVLPGFEANTWFAIYAPKGTPEPILQKLNRAIGEVLEMPKVQEILRNHGAVPMHKSVAELKAMEEADRAKWAQVIKSGGIKLE